MAVIVIRSSQDCHREDDCQDDVDNNNEEHEGVLVKECSPSSPPSLTLS